MAAPDSPASTPYPAPAPLVGRWEEQRVLRKRLRSALEGHGGLVLIGGEAGIGKTTLVDWLGDEARQQGAQVLIGRCYDLAQAPPYGPWREAFAAAANQSAESHPLSNGAAPVEAASQGALFAQVRAYLERLAATKPVMLVLEDLHWSDPASMELLRDLARGLEGLPMLLAATYRADELTRQHPLFLHLPHLVREARPERLDLARLTAADIRVLVGDRYHLPIREEARLANYLTARSGGNPFFLDELLRTLEGDRILHHDGDRWRVADLDTAAVPPLVRQIIEHRLQQLAPETLRLLEVAAVIGLEVPFDLWQAAGDATDERLADAAEEAIATHLILEAPGEPAVRFAHALVQETLAVRQPLRRRRAAHRRVAELLAARHNPAASVVASHFASADDPRAVVWLTRAGAQALALYAARDAVAALSRAHELASRLAQPLPASAYHDRAAAYALLGEFDNARHDYELVLERARTADDHLTEWRALIDLGLLWSERDYERTGNYGRAALDLARSIGDDLTIARSLNHIANWHVNREQPDLAIPQHQEALAIFERHGDQQGIADTLDLLGMASYLSVDYGASTEYYERAIAWFRELDDRPRLASSLTNLALTGNDVAIGAALTYREATYWLRSGEEGLEVARDIGWMAGEAFAHFCLGFITGIRGQFGRSLAHAQAAEDLARQINHHQWTVAAHIGWASIWIELLDFELGIAEMEQGLAAARVSGSRFWTNLAAGRLGSALVASGQLDQAAALIGGVIQTEAPPRSLGQRQCWIARIELLLASHEPEQALQVIDVLAEAIPRSATAPGPAPILKLRGDALAQLHDHVGSERAYLAARQSAALYGFLTILWKIDDAHGQLLTAQRRTKEAEAAFQRARLTIAEMAETIPDGTIREAFIARALPRLPAASPVDGHRTATLLSPRELEVLRLIVEGQSDREIAAALSISHRTVMRHVTGILTKLDVTSRTAAATQAMRLQIV